MPRPPLDPEAGGGRRRWPSQLPRPSYLGGSRRMRCSLAAVARIDAAGLAATVASSTTPRAQASGPRSLGCRHRRCCRYRGSRRSMTIRMVGYYLADPCVAARSTTLAARASASDGGVDSRPIRLRASCSAAATPQGCPVSGRHVIGHAGADLLASWPMAVTAAGLQQGEWDIASAARFSQGRSGGFRRSASASRAAATSPQVVAATAWRRHARPRARSRDWLPTTPPAATP